MHQAISELAAQSRTRRRISKCLEAFFSPNLKHETLPPKFMPSK